MYNKVFLFYFNYCTLWMNECELLAIIEHIKLVIQLVKIIFLINEDKNQAENPK